MHHKDDSIFNVAEIGLIYRSRVKAKDRLVVTTSKMAYEIFRQSWDENKIELCEQFKILLLNQRKGCLGISEICTGGISSCVVDTRLVFMTALKANRHLSSWRTIIRPATCNQAQRI